MKAARSVLLSRQMDRLEVEELTPQGNIKYQFSAGGHELAQVLLAQALDHPHDGVSVYYRSRPFMLSCGLSALEALASGMAKSGSVTEGREVGVMFNLPGKEGLTVLPASGDVGAQYTPAAGWAQAILYHQRVLDDKAWESAMAVAMGGEGSVAANGFWGALNMTTTLKLPMLFFIENNNFGLSVPSTFQTPGGNIAANLESYPNLLILDGDGTDPAQAWELIKTGVMHVRSGVGPCLLHLRVVRLSGHTFVDNQAYKTPETLEEEARRDPMRRLREFLENRGVSHEDWQKLSQSVAVELAQAHKDALAAAGPDPSGVTQHLFFTGKPPRQGGLRPLGRVLPLGSSQPQPGGPRINFIDAVRCTLEHEMRLNPYMLVFGEDVGVKGGVHGATQDMWAHFGAERVFDTSLSEEAIIGRSTGMALAGLLPVPEIQFRKYADPAHEQLSDIGTVRWRTANRFAAPVVVRIPVGFGKKIGDPWHSVSGEAIFAHLPGWRIAYPSNAEDAAGLLRTALRGDDPTFFLEHRALLDAAESRRPYPGDDYCLPFGKAARLESGDELAVVSWGAMVYRCLEAAQDFPGRVTVLDLRTVVPWDQEAVLEAVSQTGKVLVVHEDTLTAGFAGEIIAVIASQAFHFLDAPVERLAVPDIPIPYNAGLMDAVVPTSAQIKQKIEGLLVY